MNKVEAVIFDWNGTLHDDLERLAYGSVVKIFETYKLSPPTLDEYRQEITASFMKFYYKHGFVRGFSEQGEDGDSKALNVIRKKYYTENGDKGNIRPDATQTVFNLRSMGIKVGIISAEIGSTLFEKLNSSDLHRLFDSQFVRAEIWGDKGVALLKICKDLDVSPGNTIYVDDTIDGTGSAKKVGLLPVGFGNETGYNSEDRLRSVTPLIIHELSEILDLVHDINWACCRSWENNLI